MAWPDGQQFGPTVPMVFAQWIAAGRVTPDARVWRTGWSEWRVASAVADELPAPLPVAESPPPAPLQAGITLPPPPPVRSPEEAAPTPLVAPKSVVSAAYLSRRRQQAKLRRWMIVTLVVLCLVLTITLVILLGSESPSTPGP